MAAKAKLVEILDQLVDDINQQEFGLEFTARRLWQPTYKLEQESKPRVSVSWSGELEIERLARQKRSEVYGVEVGVYKRLSELNNEQIDPLVLLAWELHEYLFVTEDHEERELGSTGAACTSISNVIFDRDALTETNVFAMTMNLTYQVFR